MRQQPLLVLHLSDLHFGANSRFGGVKPSALARVLFNTLEKERTARDIRVGPDLVIVTGDIAETAEPREYQMAALFFTSLASYLSLEHQQFIFVPGNHDVSWSACKEGESLQQSGELVDDLPLRDAMGERKFEPFYRFLRDFYKRPPEELRVPLARGAFVHICESLEVAVVGLNSCEIESHRREDHGGFISEQQAQAVLDYGATGALDPYFRLVAIHHNPSPTIARPDLMEYLREQEAKGILTPKSERFAADALPLEGREFLHAIAEDLQVQVVLHGHYHKVAQDPWAWRGVPLGQTHVLSAGSWGLAPPKMPKDQPNAVQLVLLDPLKAEVKAWVLVYDPRERPKGQVSPGGFVMDPANPSGYCQRLTLPTGWRVPQPALPGPPLPEPGHARPSHLPHRVLDVIAAFIESTVTTGQDLERAQRRRHLMLELVKHIWVRGVLEQSLHGAAMVELGLQEVGGEVERPWDVVMQVPDRPNRTLPPNTKMVDVFDEMNASLLILGEPGSGKTTMLLELARDKIALAEQDSMQPIPVVFNLSSWAEKRQPLDRWLVHELNVKYNIPKKIARPWVENDELLFLLDGLDEVKLEHREASVKAINDFRQQHLVPLVVCSRIADYKALTTRLKLRGAVLLQPLTPEQIEAYLGGASAELQAVRDALRHDPTLQELAQSPLLLSVMTLAYRGISPKDLRTLDTPAARRRHLFATYIERMFERRGLAQPYRREQIHRGLSWLAQKMIEHGQTIFLVERLQPDWLTARAQRLARLGAWLICVPALALLLGLVGGLAGQLAYGVPWGLLTTGAFLALFFGLLVGLVVITTDTVEPMDALRWSWRGSIAGLASGPLIGLAIGLLALWLGGLVSGLVVGAFIALAFGLLAHARGSSGGLAAALLIGLTIALALWVFIERFGWQSVVFLGLVAGLCLAPLVGLSNVEMQNRTFPNQGIRQSMKNVLFIAVSLALAAGLGLWSADVLFIGMQVGPPLWILDGLALGLFFGLLASGVPVILHFALRYALWRSGYLPWCLVRFLNYAAERIFLRKVGGGYIFTHRLLMEHFASSAPQPSQGKGTPPAVPGSHRKWVAGASLFLVIAVVALFANNRDLRHRIQAQAYHIAAGFLGAGSERGYQYALQATDLVPDSADYLNAVCWFGSLSRHAAQVMDACERAVVLAPDNGAIRDSRGLARGLTGDPAGAIEDFRFYIQWVQRPENSSQRPQASKRERWLQELRGGPLDVERILKELRP